jgi:hypothetical protein
MNRTGAIGLGATVGELRAPLDKLPADMPIVVRAPDGVCGAIVNAGVDTFTDESGHQRDIFAIEVSDDPNFVRAEDERRKGSGSTSTDAKAEPGHPKPTAPRRRRSRP